MKLLREEIMTETTSSFMQTAFSVMAAIIVAFFFTRLAWRALIELGGFTSRVFKR